SARRAIEVGRSRRRGPAMWCPPTSTGDRKDAPPGRHGFTPARGRDMFPAMSRVFPFPAPATRPVGLTTAILLVVPLLACVPARTVPEAPASPLDPLDFVAPDASRLQDARFVARAAAARYVLLGETHHDPCHHRAQARAVDLLSRTPTPPAV